MERQNIWDSIEKREFKPQVEYRRLARLLFDRNFISRRSNYQYISLLELSDNFFQEYRNRGTYLSIVELLEDLEIFRDTEPVTLDDLDLLIEFIFIVGDIIQSNISMIEQYFSNVKETMVLIIHNIDSILVSTNQKIVHVGDDGGKIIVVPNDETVIAAANIALPEDEGVAFAILGYSHYSNKNNVEAKRDILKKLSDYLEIKLKSSNAGNIKYIINGFGIRHLNSENRRVLEQIDDTELNEIYDMVYQEMLYFIMGDSHDKFVQKIEELKGRFHPGKK